MISTDYNARTADKFVVRLPAGMRKRIEDMATKNHTSMNSEIILAIEAHLNHHTRQGLLLDALEAKLAQTAPSAKPQALAPQPDVDYLDGLKSSTR